MISIVVNYIWRHITESSSHIFASHAHSYTSFGKSHLTAWSVFDGWQLWFTERPLRNPVFTLFHHVSHVLHRETDVRSFLVYPSIHAHRHTWIRSFVHNTCELRGLLLAPGERREAQEAGEANLDGPLSPGLTPLPGLSGWAAAAGWKKSAGRWKPGEDPPPPPLQLPPSASEKRLYFNTALSVCSSSHYVQSSTNKIMTSTSMQMTPNSTSALPDGIDPVIIMAKHSLQLNKDQTEYSDVRTQAKIGWYYLSATCVATSEGNLW